MPYIVGGIVVGIVLLIGFGAVVFWLVKKSKTDQSEFKIIAEYVTAQKNQSEECARIKELKKQESREKLETFKQTREQLRERLKNQIDAKDWKSLETILDSADKGGMGIYIMYNQTKNKYYVGQAKQLYKRVREHFKVEDIAHDFIGGDEIQVKFLTAAEIGDDYRIDHIEKTGIEIFTSKGKIYNKTTGNL